MNEWIGRICFATRILLSHPVIQKVVRVRPG
jgi:hypothetical protein